MIRKLFPALLMSGILLIGCSKKMSEEQLFAEAQKFEAKEDIDGALKIYEELSDRFPTSPKADSVLQKLGMIYLNKKEAYDKAAATYQAVVDKFPQSRHHAQSMFMVGYIYANHIKDLDKARQCYNAFLEKYPQHDLSDDVQFELANLGKDPSDFFKDMPAAMDGAPAKVEPAVKSGATVTK
jgi:outer membrane protein assembly factor BamD (BamD/ComL family)